MVEYRALALEPFITQAATEEAKDFASDILRKELAKPEIDLVPLVMEEDGEKYAVITGNSIKGAFRAAISAQLTQAGIEVCVQDVKKGDVLPEGRKEQCKPENPCFVCTWFGTAGRQGVLHFSFLRSVNTLKDVLATEPHTDDCLKG
jgi:CRISPR/Cas system CSM-associated protein Csm3 (group 7 of RAMP superfamily)